MDKTTKKKVRTNLPKRLTRKLVFSSSRLKLFHDSVRMPSGRIINDFHFIKYNNNTVVIVLANSNYEICLIKSLRYTTNKVEWELPAGGIERNESPLIAAKREILEETGICIDMLEHIYSFIPSNGISDNLVYVFVGQFAENSQTGNIDVDEILEVQWLSIEKVFGLIRSGKITDGISLLAIFLYLHLYCNKNYHY